MLYSEGCSSGSEGCQAGQGQGMVGLGAMHHPNVMQRDAPVEISEVG